MKFKITKTTDGKYNWTLYASNGQAVAGHNQGYNKPTNLSQSVNKFIIRDDEKLAAAFAQAMKELGCGPDGRTIRRAH